MTSSRDAQALGGLVSFWFLRSKQRNHRVLAEGVRVGEVLVLVSVTGFPIENLQFIPQVYERFQDCVPAPEACLLLQVFVRWPTDALLVCVLREHKQHVMLCWGFRADVAGKLYPLPR